MQMEDIVKGAMAIIIGAGVVCATKMYFDHRLASAELEMLRETSSVYSRTEPEALLKESDLKYHHGAGSMGKGQGSPE